MAKYDVKSGMNVLRDLRLSTKLLILLEVAKSPRLRLKSLAEELGMTVQGVSEYIQRMSEEGLVENAGGYVTTKKGVQFLHEHFTDLKSFVESASRDLSIVNICTALARTDVLKGDRVGLFMENGLLTAYASRKSDSTGIAASDGRRGEDIAVKDLEGIVRLRPGRLWILKVPSAASGGTRKMSLEKLERRLQSIEHEVIAIFGIEADVLSKKLGYEATVRFAPIPAAIEACQKGLSVLLLVSMDYYKDAKARLDKENSFLGEKIEIREIPGA